MEIDTNFKKIAVVSLVAVMIISAAAYDGYVSYKSKNSGLTGKTSETKNTSTSNTADYDSIFKKDSVIDIKVDIADMDWKSILDNPLAEEYKIAKVTVNGTTVENVGFRTKGNLTLRSVASSTSDRFSFRIKLDEYVKGQNLQGLDEFVVNNMYSDPSYLREYLSYEALREIGSDVPEAVFANIYINGELYGFYLCVEAIDDSFLERNFGNNDGNLYKQEKGSTLKYAEDGKYDSYELKEGDDETKADLNKFIKVLNDMPKGQKGDIESVLDVDSALKYIAANTVLGNYDSYSGNMAQNYYLYAQEGKFTVVPWDYNMSMSGFNAGGNAATIPIDEPVMGVSMNNVPLINNLLSVEEYKMKYHEYVQQLLTYLDKFESRVTEVGDVIRPYVKEDPNKFVTLEEFEENIKYSETSAVPTVNAVQGNVGNAPQLNPDANAGASQNPDNAVGGQMQRPEGMPGVAQDGNRPAPPDGGIRGDVKGGHNGGGGGGMMKASSIVNFIRDRITNIKKQLAGELPTTGNTTMNNNRMGGN